MKKRTFAKEEKLESTPKSIEMIKTVAIFILKGTFYAKKGLFGVASIV